MKMEKPNRLLYNSHGHYEADLEKYNEMKSAEDIKTENVLQFEFVIVNDTPIERTEVIKVLFETLRNKFPNSSTVINPTSYAAQFKAEPSQSKPVYDMWLAIDIANKVQSIPSVKSNSFDALVDAIEYVLKPAMLQTQPSQCAVSDEDIKGMAEVEYPYRTLVGFEFPQLHRREGYMKGFKAALRKQVWDCSDIAVKYQQWTARNSEWYAAMIDVWVNSRTGEEKSTSALFSYWFNEIYNKK